MERPPVAIVTGGSRGIGKATVVAMCDRGYRVVFTGRDDATGRATEARIPGSTFVRGDAARDADVANAIDRALELGSGGIAALINNAGQSRRVRFEHSTVEDWDDMHRVNARSAYLATRFAIDGLTKARGAVVMVSSVAGLGGEEELSAYCASKGALLSLTQTLALELGARVRFNAVCPGQVRTRMMARVVAEPQLAGAYSSRIPVGRFASPAEIAEVIAWLVSPAASFVNGAVIVADGGETAGLRTLDPSLITEGSK